MQPLNQQQTVSALIAIARAARDLISTMSDKHANDAALTSLEAHLDSLDGPAGEGDPIDLAAARLNTLHEPDDIASLMEKRTRMFPRMTVTLAEQTPEQQEALRNLLKQHRDQTLYPVDSPFAGMPVLTAGADVQRDGIQFEFEPQEWKAPAETPPDRERRMRERMIEPAIPVVGKEALVEATRPLFVKAMQSQGYRADFDGFTGLFKDASEHRWEGWRAAVESMGFKPASDDIGALREQAEAWNVVAGVLDTFAPGWRALSTRGYTSAAAAIEQLATSTKNEIRTNMLADTADEALRIINDAGLLRDLRELHRVDEMVSIMSHSDTSWTMKIGPRGASPRSYGSTSFHQLIVVAHKGEQDREYPEPEECQFCGFTVETPCDAPPPAECDAAVAAQVASMPKPTIEHAQSVDAQSPRQEMNALLLKVKEKKGTIAAKALYTHIVESRKMADIPDNRVEEVIAACLERLKQK